MASWRHRLFKTGHLPEAPAAITSDPSALLVVGRHLLIDEWPDASRVAPSTTVRLDATGLHVAVDIASVMPGGTGHLELDMRWPVPTSVLSALPFGDWRGSLACPDPTVALLHI